MQLRPLRTIWLEGVTSHDDKVARHYPQLGQKSNATAWHGIHVGITAWNGHRHCCVELSQELVFFHDSGSKAHTDGALTFAEKGRAGLFLFFIGKTRDFDYYNVITL